MVFFIQIALSQSIDNLPEKASDIELWNGIEFSKKVAKKTDFSFTYQLRFNENLQRFKSTFVQFGLSFPVKQIHKNFILNPNFRLIRNFDQELIKRPLVDIGMRLHRSDLLQVNYKMRIQKDFEHFINKEFDLDFYWRNRITISFLQLSDSGTLKDIKPYIGAILFTRAYYKGSRSDQFRFLVGITYKAKKRQSIRLGYIYRTRFNVAQPSTSHIITFKMDFEVKDFKKKKKSSK